MTVVRLPPSHMCKAYQIQVSLKGAELLGAEIARENCTRKLLNISNAKRPPRFWPGDNERFVWLCSSQSSLALEHFIQSPWKLLRNSTLSSAGVWQCRKIAHVGWAGIGVKKKKESIYVTTALRSSVATDLGWWIDDLSAEVRSSARNSNTVSRTLSCGFVAMVYRCTFSIAERGWTSSNSRRPIRKTNWKK